MTKVRFDNDLSGVIGEAVVEKETAKLFCRDSILYLTGPKFGLSGVEHLDTILTGAYIDVTPGTGETHTEFTVLTQQPGGNKSYAGLNIILDASGLGSLKKGSPIYYRQIQVGRITGFELSPTAQTVWVRANIHPAYTMLIYQGTRFWDVSGIRVTGGVFSGLTVDTESMEALVTGGVALATPEGEEMGRPAENGDHFALIDAAKKEWEQWRPELPFKENLSGETTPIEVPAENVPVNGQQQVEHDQYGWD